MEEPVWRRPGNSWPRVGLERHPSRNYRSYAKHVQLSFGGRAALDTYAARSIEFPGVLGGRVCSATGPSSFRGNTRRGAKRSAQSSSRIQEDLSLSDGA